MSFSVQDQQGAPALDIAQLIRRIYGYAVISGGLVISSPATPWAIDIEETTALVAGNRYTTPAAQEDLESLVDDENPKKCIVYIDLQGDIAIAEGVPERPDPSDETRFDTARPTPPGFSQYDGTPIAEIWLDKDDGQVTNDDIRPRTLSADITVAEAVVASLVLTGGEMTDPGGRRHTGSLAAESDLPEDADILAAVAADATHGDLPSHNYLTPDEVRAAVAGVLDAADLTAETGEAGDYLAALADGSAEWRPPPKAEAPVEAQGTVTHTASGGDSSHPRVDGIVDLETSYFDIDVGVSTALAEDYGFNYDDHTKHWDNAAGHWDATLHINWDEPPASGTDLELSYTVYNTKPAIVTGGLGESDIPPALQGTEIAPAVVDVATALELPEYDELSEATTVGVPIVYITGDGPAPADPAGIYIYRPDLNGGAGAWDSITAAPTLSEVVVDGPKDFGGNTLRNLGAPQNAADSARKAEVDTVKSDLTAHTSASDAHGGHYDDADTIGVLIDTTTWNRAESVGIGKSVPIVTADIPSGDEIRVYRTSFHTTGSGIGAVPTGLALRLVTQDAPGSSNYTLRETVIEGDGSFSRDRSATSSLTPIATWTNTTGSAQLGVLVVDNGRFGSDGSGGSGTSTNQSFMTEGTLEVRDGP